jgi:rhamnogalacturonan endolyase
MAITDDIQRYMPSAADREEPRAVPLAYKEAVLLVDPKEPQFRGEVYTYIVIYGWSIESFKFGGTVPSCKHEHSCVQVDDKYQYSLDNKDNVVHGWISRGDPNAVGFWVITPSNEFKSGGPLKRELTSHVGPTSLTVSLSQVASTIQNQTGTTFILYTIVPVRCLWGHITLASTWWPTSTTARRGRKC